MSDPVRDAKQSAYNTACAQWDNSIPREVIAKAFSEAQMNVMRTLLSRLLPDGEVGFWRLVEEEVKK